MTPGIEQLSPTDHDRLATVCAVLIATGDDESGRAAARSVAADVEAAVVALEGSVGLARLRRLLDALDSPLVNLAVSCRPVRFSTASAAGREQLLLAWANGPWTFARTAFQAIKRLAMFVNYAPTLDDKRGASDRCDIAQPKLGYLPDVGPPVAPRASVIRPLAVTGEMRLTADVLVIGSGAGGGVVAGELAAAGCDVLVVEKGAAPSDSELPRDERRAFHELYERHGSLTTVDRGVTVLAGSTLGGGTTVNWMTSLAPPDEVLEEWGRDYGFAAATSREFRQSIAAVSRRLGVNESESLATPHNAVLDRGCRVLGYRVHVIPRNAQGCTACDTCSFGCAQGGKQDMRRTYLRDAAEHGARFLVGAEVLRILHRGGAATGAELRVRTSDASEHRVTVAAKVVVVACGAIHTPALLIRSGLTNRHIGANLHLHPTTAVCGEFTEPVRSWSGAPQTRYCDELADLDGMGHGVRLEVSPAHPGLWALALTWRSAADHRRRMERIDHWGNIIVIARDRHSGRVAVDDRGQPRLQYRIGADDARRLLRGAVEALRIQVAAGAIEVLSPHQRNRSWRRADGTDFEKYLAGVAGDGRRVNDLGLFSAHQLSSCRIAGSSRQGAVRPDGRTYELDNLYVADGSILPSACGVNPMITIAALAHHVAAGLKSRLGR